MIFSSKIIADGDCSHEIKRRLLLGRKAVTNLDSILKSRDITADKVRTVKAMDFSSSHVWTWKLDHKEGWVPKNWCFQTVVLEKTLESPVDSKRSNQPILKEINPEYSLEMRAAENEMVRQHHWLNGHESDQTPGDGEGQGSLVCCSPWGRKESDTT